MAAHSRHAKPNRPPSNVASPGAAGYEVSARDDRKAPSARRLDLVAALLLVLFAAALTWIQLTAHPTPHYGVETDLIGDLVPAAKELRAGTPLVEHFEFKGFGYPLVLAGAATLCGNDFWLAARLVNTIAAVLAGAIVFLLVRRVAGAKAALLVLLGVLLNGPFLEASIESGTDMPALALALGATFLLIRAEGAWSLLAAGIVAGLAIVTRYNSAFLIPAALIALMFRPGRARALAAYLAGAALPLGAWMAMNASFFGDPFHNRNFMNIAYEVYGRGAGWEEFTNNTSAQFHSLGDVVRYDPGRFFARLGSNLATRWMRDVKELTPLWVGVFAVPGLFVGWWTGRREPARDGETGRGGSDLAIHYALGYIVLATVFYAPRFSLYLIPCYLLAVAMFYLHAPIPRRRVSMVVRVALLAGLFVASGVPAVMSVRTLLASAPHEVREGGLLLRSIGAPGERVMARKPHVAYFADMEFVALPDVFDLADLVRVARESRAHYLFFSAIERSLRPQFALLADSGVALPGLAPLAYRSLDSTRFFALYRVTDEPVDGARMRDSVLAALVRVIQRRPDQGWPYVLLADQLVQAGRFAEALRVLATADPLAPRDPMLARVRSVAYFQLGAYDSAAAASERVMELGAATSWDHAHLGHIRLAQSRYAEARRELEAAIALEPARTEYLAGLGIARYHTGDFEGAARALEKVLAAQPENLEARLYAARAWRAMGRGDLAQSILEAGPRDPELVSLADSIRSGR